MTVTVKVHDQTELDQALADNADEIIIDSPAGVWLTLIDSGASRVVARDTSSVVAWGASRVVAWDTSSVVARDTSSVVARDTSRVVAWGASRVVARDTSRVEAGKYVAVHLHSQRVTLDGGVVIDMTAVDRDDPQTWADLHGRKVADGRVTVYKGVDCDLRSGHGTLYPIGTTVTCDDWNPIRACGNGLHFSPSPAATDSYGLHDRYLAVTVAISEMVPLGDKIKAPSCVVVREVDRFGDPVAQHQAGDES